MRWRTADATFLLIGLAILASAASACAAQTDAPDASQARAKIALNDGWKFLPQNLAGAEAIEFDDAKWAVVDVPHTWNAEDPFDDEPEYRREPSWYRKHMTVPERLKGRRLFLHFEGVHQLTDVFVNGKSLGQHKGGYTAFAFDVTDVVRFGPDAPNVIAVRADNSHNDSIPPLDIGYAFYGGIYRDVWLIATAPVHFDALDHASPGIYVDTPKVTKESGTVRIRGTVVNDGDGAKDLRVVSVVLDGQKHVVARIQSKLAVPPKGRTAFEQMSEPIASPKLWSPDDPYLYDVESAIEDASGPLDRVQSHLGFRWFKFDPNEGFILNGSRYPLHGASRHQDYEGLGSALPNWLHRSDIAWVKRMGGNFLRLAHYPQEQEVLDAADRLGLIVWEEIPIVSTMSASPEFAATCRTNLTEMIRQHYNHPCVVMWGYMNEVFLNYRRQKDPPKEFPAAVLKLAKELEAIARKEDPTRVTVMAMDGSPYYDEVGLSEIPMVAGWNLYHGWYGGEFDGFGRFLDNQHSKHPQRCLIVSEYGAGSDERLHSLKPQRFDHTTEYMFQFHESHWKQIRERSWLCGSLIWNQFDFSQPKAADSIAHVNQKGMLTWDRRPKDVFYFYQANWISEPVLHIASREWSRRTGPGSAASGSADPQPVVVYSNLDEVELLVNGMSAGKKKPDDLRRARWDVSFIDGWNTLEATGSRGARQLRDACKVHFASYPATLGDGALFDELAVNVGSNAQFIDASGLVWEADRPYTKGAWGHTGGTARFERMKASRVLNEIFGTPAEPLYQFDREGIETFRFDLPDGDYELDLRFTEYDLNTPGKRVFRVLFNGESLIDRLDLFAEYGARRAVDRVFVVRVVGGKGAQVRFEPVVGKPVLSGIRIRRLP